MMTEYEIGKLYVLRWSVLTGYDSVETLKEGMKFGMLRLNFDRLTRERVLQNKTYSAFKRWAELSERVFESAGRPKHLQPKHGDLITIEIRGQLETDHIMTRNIKMFKITCTLDQFLAELQLFDDSGYSISAKWLKAVLIPRGPNIPPPVGLFLGTVGLPDFRAVNLFTIVLLDEQYYYVLPWNIWPLGISDAK